MTGRASLRVPYIDPDGYVIIKARGPWRDWREHRKVIAELIEETHPLTLASLPPLKDMEVHHIDGRRAHNCSSNLLLIDPALHVWAKRERSWTRAASADRGAPGDDAPSWVTEETE